MYSHAQQVHGTQQARDAGGRTGQDAPFAWLQQAPSAGHSCWLRALHCSHSLRNTGMRRGPALHQVSWTLQRLTMSFSNRSLSAASANWAVAQLLAPYVSAAGCSTAAGSVSSSSIHAVGAAASSSSHATHREVGIRLFAPQQLLLGGRSTRVHSHALVIVCHSWTCTCQPCELACAARACSICRYI